MYLNKILSSHEYLSSLEKPHSNPFITGISADSNYIKEGFIFVALKGASKDSLDGHSFIQDAINKKAALIVAQQGFSITTEIPIFYVEDTAKAFSFLSEAFYDWPSKKLSVIGITGTNGKTSTSFMLYEILKKAGKNPKIMGSLGMGDINNLTPLTHTTMPAAFISEQLSNFYKNGVDFVIMEVSSHALSLKRVEAINFSLVALTNITQDHLDFHGDMQAYKNAKKRLFTQIAQNAIKILPCDNPLALDSHKFYSYAPILPIVNKNNQTCFSVKIKEELLVINLNLTGIFQAYNAALAASIAFYLGINKTDIIMGLSHVTNISGRFQIVKEAYEKNFMVVVDFAHTPDALINLLKSAQLLKPKKIILVFGCGGNRDQTKRKIMGEIANNNADIVIVTDDNPRFEEPHSIRQEILSGITDNKQVFEIADREEAIKKAILMAQPGYLVLLAGKGHEHYQIYGEEKSYFNDYEKVIEIIGNL